MISSLRTRFQRVLTALGLFDSAAYWSARYRRGETSGSGSYGENARYKADFLNSFVQDHGARTVIEFGCGDGAQADLFTFDAYTGVDVTQEAVELCRVKLHRPNWAFHNLKDSAAYAGQYDVVLSLDVVYHLIEDHVFDAYMTSLFDHAGGQVLVYSSDHDERSAAAHVRHRKHSDWVAQHRPEWEVAAVHENPRAGQSADAVFAFFTCYQRRAA